MDIESVESGALSMEPDAGLVWRRFAVDGGDTDIEQLGFIGDEDAAPFDLLDEWNTLAEWWRESRGGGHAREAEWSWYERFSVRGMN